MHSFRTAVRSLKRQPRFVAGVVAILGVGIGLATAVGVVAEALLLQPLPVHDQGRLVALSGVKRDGSSAAFPVGLAEAKEFEARTRALESVASHLYEGAFDALFRDGDYVTRMKVALVSGNFFDVLGVQPVLGRALNAQDDMTGAAPVLVLSHSAWQRRFAGDPAIVGRKFTAHSNGNIYTVVGVMPRGLEFPRSVEFWAATRAIVEPKNLQYVAVYLIGRLAPGATPTAARDELSNFFTSPGASPFQRDLRGSVRTLPDLIVGDIRLPLVVFSAAAALLLLITCLNAANLLLVRGLARVREVAIRTALGASRARVARQLLAENALLALLGGLVALPIAFSAVRSFVVFAPVSVPRVTEISFNAVGYAAAAAIAVAALVFFGVAPAFATASSNVQHALRSGTRASQGRSRRASEWLVGVQVTLAFIILSATALITRSLVNLQREKLAFDPARLLVAELAFSSQRYGGPTEQSALLDELIPALRGIPGVRSVAPVVATPFTEGWSGRPATEGQLPEQAGANPVLNMEVITPAYFETFGLQVLRGRPFDDTDRRGAPPVALVSETAARQYWPGADAVGKKLFMGPKLEEKLTVVGVVPDTRYRDLREARASIYFPLAQSFFPFAPTTLVIRTDVPPASVVSGIRRAVAERFPGVAVAAASPFADYLAEPLAQPRLNVFLLSAFAAAAVLLAASGLFGIMMLMVRQRTREIGVRMALGATAVDVRRLVFGRAFHIAGAGVVVGLAGALALNQSFAAMLYAVRPTDATTLGAVVMLLLGTTALATLVPSRASTRVNPMEALRADD
jgi:putative ABC transport system permease protein